MTYSPLVLIVEDSPIQAEQLAAELTQYDVRPLVAGDGPEGLRTVDEYQPDLIVLDVNLPTMDGYQVCHRLRRDTNTAHIPVVMLTVSEDFEATMRGLETGADDHIPKDVYAGSKPADRATCLRSAGGRVGQGMQRLPIGNVSDLIVARDVLRETLSGANIRQLPLHARGSGGNGDV